MADEVDIDALLEASYKTSDSLKNGDKQRRSDKSSGDKDKRSKSDKHRRSAEREKRRSGSRTRDRGHVDSRIRDRRGDDRDKERERDHERDKERVVRHQSRSRSRERRYRESPPPYRSRSRGGDAGRYFKDRPASPSMRRRSPPGYNSNGPPNGPVRKLPGPERRDVMPFTPKYSPPRGVDINAELTPEDRDLRTVFCMQLARTIRPRDLEEFFSSVGKVRDVRIITDSKTRRSKGIGYVEFWDTESVPLALGLTGQRLLGAPIVIQPTQSEKNRMASAALLQTMNQSKGPMKLYVGSLHFNITEEMLRGIFEPFGKIDSIQILKDPETNRSRGYGFVTYHTADDAKRAMEQLNGFELAGRSIKVANVNEHGGTGGTNSHSLDSDEMDRAGIDLGTTGRLQLMAKLAEGTGMQLPQVAQQMLNMQHQQQVQQIATPPIATQCFMLSNMFDPAQETEPNWDVDVRADVIEECNKHGGVVHILVDKASPQGNVYVKCPTIASAVASVTSLHGRWFSGKIITANYVPVANYHQLFPAAIHATALLTHATTYNKQMTGAQQSTQGSLYA